MPATSRAATSARTGVAISFKSAGWRQGRQAMKIVADPDRCDVTDGPTVRVARLYLERQINSGSRSVWVSAAAATSAPETPLLKVPQSPR